ncbi:MAG TPA: hypothetical protein PK788_09795, partial [Gemmatimonadaceae bacterium]|nr:hypothetical protein [Gemmatimonadaceae bacterium]
MPRTLLAALIALSLTAAPAHAQLGASLGFRSLTDERPTATDRDRRGFEGRLHYARDQWGAFGWQAELIGSQMRAQRDDGLSRYKVSENSLELAALLRGRLVNGALAGAYALGGPVASWRVVCGASGQPSTWCDERDDRGTGYVLGLGYQSPLTPRRDLIFELRYYDGIVAGASSPILSLSLGLVVAD